MTAAATEIADRVWRLDLGPVNAYLVADDEGAVLVDTGPRGRSDALFAAIAATGQDRVHTVLVTHHHVDHTGSLAEVKRRTGATAVMHRLDGTVTSGAAPAPRVNPLALLAGLVRGRPERTAVETLFDEARTVPLAGWQAVHTPGHTAGHLSFLLDRSGGVLFAGDAARHADGRVRLPGKVFSDDLAVAEMSVRHLTALDFEVACFGHGPPVTGGARQGFHDCLAEVSAW